MDMHDNLNIVMKERLQHVIYVYQRVIDEGWMEPESKRFAEYFLKNPWIIDSYVCVIETYLSSFLREKNELMVICGFRQWLERNGVLKDWVTEEIAGEFAAIVSFVALELHRREENIKWN